MPICRNVGCTSGPDGRRFSGDAEAVNAHEVAVHGKRLGGRVKGKDVKISKSVFWIGVYRGKSDDYFS